MIDTANTNAIESNALASQSLEGKEHEQFAPCTNVSEVYMKAVEYVELASNECLKTEHLDINLIIANSMSCANALITLIPHEENPTRRQALQQISIILEGHIAVLLKQRTQMQSGGNCDFQQNSKPVKVGSLDKYRVAIESTLLPYDTNCTFKQITGYDRAKSILKECLIFPKLFQGIFPLKNQNILLYGPPGTGKTQLAHALANEFNAKCFSISSSDILSSWVGESEKFIKSLLQIASSQEDYTLILLDEIDSLCRQRQSSEEDYSRRIKTELMQQMEKGAHAPSKLSIIGITNCPWDLDKAFLRRFNKRVYIPPPDLKTKRQLMISSLTQIEHELTEEDFEGLAANLDCFSCSDICSLCCEAMLGPFRELQEISNWEWNEADKKWRPVAVPSCSSVKKTFYDIPTDQICPRKLALQDFTKALEEIQGTISLGDLTQFEEFTKSFGVNA